MFGFARVPCAISESFSEGQVCSNGALKGRVMQRSLFTTRRLPFKKTGLALLGACMIAGAVNASPAQARDQTAAAPAHQTGTAVSEGRPYFIEFRSRNAANYGHAFVLYGRVGTKGTIAGLHPAGDRPDCVNCSVVAWTIGHILPVPAETGASDGDDEPELYLTARYRVRLTAAEYKKVVAFSKKKQADTKTWNALVNNCVEFIGGIADYMGLKVPSPIGIFATRVYVEELAQLNGGKILKTAKLPDGLVRDAPSSFTSGSAANTQRDQSVSN
ncbi:MAG: hypothetical protein ACR2K5_10075 [Pseudolabrys sp.]